MKEKLSTEHLYNSVIWFLTVFLVMSFYIFAQYSWGKYVLAAVSTFVFFISLFNYGGFIFKLGSFHFMVSFFAFYVATSALWAISSGDALSKAKTLVEILVCMSLVYIHYYRTQDVYALVNSVKWAGNFVSVYAILYYGLDEMYRVLNDSGRIDGEFANINSIGMLAAMAVVLNVYDVVVFKRFTWSLLFVVPSIIIIAGTASKKAVLILLVGAVLVFVLKNFGKRISLQSVFKVLLSLIGIFFVFSIASKMSIFSGVVDRMSGLAALISGEGQLDASTNERKEFIELGFEIFSENFVGGIGIGNPHILAATEVGNDTYLHNNFVELLAGGGVLGFVIYYSIYVYLAYNIIKYREADRNLFIIGWTLLVLVCMLDIALVSYYDKMTYFYFMILFLCVEKMRSAFRIRGININE